MLTQIPTPALPFPAWEQAVFVALFVFMILAVLAWVDIQNSKRDKFQASESLKWREFLKEQRASDEHNSEAVTQAVQALTEVITGLVQEVRLGRADFQAHDVMEKTKLEEMSKTIHKGIGGKTEPRK